MKQNPIDKLVQEYLDNWGGRKADVAHMLKDMYKAAWFDCCMYHEIENIETPGYVFARDNFETMD